jgi:hypothetical protein
MRLFQYKKQGHREEEREQEQDVSKNQVVFCATGEHQLWAETSIYRGLAAFLVLSRYLLILCA